MKKPNEYLEEFMRLLELPEEARPVLADAGKRLMDGHGEELGRLCRAFMDNLDGGTDEVYEQLDRLAEASGVHSYTASFVFLAWCAQELEQKYRERGISMEIFRETMMDLRCKLMECRTVRGIWGTFVRGWYPDFYACKRFAFGRLQFEFDGFRADSYSAGGITVRKGDRVINMHIPSAGPLTKELREDSYRRAYSFYKSSFPDGPIPFACSSWLLYPEHDRFLPEGSNIVSFLHDFDIVRSEQTEEFSDSWRVFGDAAGKPPAELPRDTSLRRAYADWLQAGGKTGYGYGVFLFDGVNFIRRDGAAPHL